MHWLNQLTDYYKVSADLHALAEYKKEPAGAKAEFEEEV